MQKLNVIRIVIGVVVLTVVSAQAVDYTWDASGGAPLDDGAGSWTGGANWYNGSTYGAWTNGIANTATIGVGSNAAGTITNTGTITLNRLTFNAPGSGEYVIDQNTVAGINILSFGGTDPTINVNANATISNGLIANGNDDRILVEAGNTLTINIAPGQTLTTLRVDAGNNDSSVLVTGGGTLALLQQNYNKFMGNANGLGSAALYITNNSTVKLLQPYCIGDNLLVDIASGSTLDVNGKADGIGYLSGGGSIINMNGSFSLDARSYYNNSDFSGVISGSGGVFMRAYGGNTQILSGTNSSNTGATTIYKGYLKIASIQNVGGGNSSLGAPTTVGNGTIALGNNADTGTLIYIGTGNTSDRVLNLAGLTGGGTVEQAGTGLLKFTSDMTATGSGAKTFTLQGSTNGTGEIAGAIVDSAGGATTLLKESPGTWTLSGANTYTGDTIITNGVLNLGSGVSFSTGTVVRISSPAIMDIDAGVSATVHELWVDGALMLRGTWGATGSGARFVDNAHFLGGGTLRTTGGVVPHATSIMIQ